MVTWCRVGDCSKSTATTRTASGASSGSLRFVSGPETWRVAVQCSAVCLDAIQIQPLGCIWRSNSRVSWSRMRSARRPCWQTPRPLGKRMFLLHGGAISIVLDGLVNVLRRAQAALESERRHREHAESEVRVLLMSGRGPHQSGPYCTSLLCAALHCRRANLLMRRRTWRRT
jgi:hypothetical protein